MAKIKTITASIRSVHFSFLKLASRQWRVAFQCACASSKALPNVVKPFEQELIAFAVVTAPWATVTIHFPAVAAASHISWMSFLICILCRILVGLRELIIPFEAMCSAQYPLGEQVLHSNILQIYNQRER